MRLFVAVAIGPAAVAGAEALMAELRQRAAELAPRARLTWVRPDRLHLTVRFIGETSQPAAARIIDSLRAPLGVAPFDATLEGVGVFPPSGPARVVWVGVAAGRDGLLAVEREVSGRLETAGVPPDRRPFDPHLTLGRVRDARGLRPARWLEEVKRRRVGEARVSSCTLFESRPGTTGHEYLPLLRTSLSG
jgi:2'-5' RNA ligase